MKKIKDYKYCFMSIVFTDNFPDKNTDDADALKYTYGVPVEEHMQRSPEQHLFNCLKYDIDSARTTQDLENKQLKRRKKCTQKNK